MEDKIQLCYRLVTERKCLLFYILYLRWEGEVKGMAHSILLRK